MIVRLRKIEMPNETPGQTHVLNEVEVPLGSTLVKAYVEMRQTAIELVAGKKRAVAVPMFIYRVEDDPRLEKRLILLVPVDSDVPAPDVHWTYRTHLAMPNGELVGVFEALSSPGISLADMRQELNRDRQALAPRIAARILAEHKGEGPCPDEVARKIAADEMTRYYAEKQASVTSS